MEKQSERFIREIKKALEAKYPPQTAKSTLEAALPRLDALLDENKDQTPEKRAHTAGRIYPAIAVFEVLADITGDREEARRFFYDFYTEQSQRVGVMLSGLLKIPGLYKCVPRLFYSTIVKKFGVSAGFAYRVHDEGKGVCRFDMLKCPYKEACDKYGCPELTGAFCDSDDGCYGNLHPRLEWLRTKTLGHGGDCCNFCIRIKYKK